MVCQYCICHATETARLEAKQETGVNDNHTVNCDKVTSGEAENSVQLETENYLKAEEEASPSIESKASTSAKTDDDVVKIAVAAIIGTSIVSFAYTFLTFEN